MLTAGNYLIFRNKIDPIIRACTVSEAELPRLPQGDLAVYQGQTSFTRSKAFYFSTARAKAQQKKLLAICRELPKMNVSLPGTACTVTSLELVKKGSSRSMLNAQMEAAEQLFALMTLAGISTFRVAASKTGITYLNADILYDFREIVLS